VVGVVPEQGTARLRPRLVVPHALLFITHAHEWWCRCAVVRTPHLDIFDTAASSIQPGTMRALLSVYALPHGFHVGCGENFRPRVHCLHLLLNIIAIITLC
jgi:hypothetical protein